jgi:hypothetical protein
VDWETVWTPKDLGGLGVLNLDLMNIGLLCKRLWELENETGLWQDILKKKYLQKETLTQIGEKPGVSQVWSGLVRLDFGKIFSMKVKPWLRFILDCRIFPLTTM